MTGDFLLVLVGLVLIASVPVNWGVAMIFTFAALQPPKSDTLSLAMWRSIAIALAASCFALLGAQSIAFVASEGAVRLLPTPIPTLLIAAGALVTSLVNVYAVRLLFKWRKEQREFRVHRRDTENEVRRHRRWDDPPEGMA